MGFLSRLLCGGKPRSSSSAQSSPASSGVKSKPTNSGHVIGSRDWHVKQGLGEKVRQKRWLPKEEYEKKFGKPGRKSPW